MPPKNVILTAVDINGREFCRGDRVMDPRGNEWTVQDIRIGKSPDGKTTAIICDVVRFGIVITLLAGQTNTKKRSGQ